MDRQTKLEIVAVLLQARRYDLALEVVDPYRRLYEDIVKMMADRVKAGEIPRGDVRYYSDELARLFNVQGPRVYSKRRR